VALPGSATFPAGAAETTIAVVSIDDSLLEGSEGVELRVGPGPGDSVGPLNQATVTIQDDERPAATIVVGDGAAGEAGPRVSTRRADPTRASSRSRAAAAIWRRRSP
jgi:hypothetical protein